MKYIYSVIHANVHCQDCDWETFSYKNAQAISKIHADTHKHRVEGELGISIVYDGRKEDKGKRIPELEEQSTDKDRMPY